MSSYRIYKFNQGQLTSIEPNKYGISAWHSEEDEAKIAYVRAVNVFYEQVVLVDIKKDRIIEISPQY